MTDVFEMEIPNHEKLSKKPAKKKKFENIGCLSFVTFFKKIFVYTVCKLKKHGFVTDITAT